MATDDRRHDGEPQACPALTTGSPWITAEETIKDALLIHWVDADAGVLDLQHRLASLAPQAQHHLTS